MASEEEATFSESTRGAGGKLKRQSARKHTATPYSRPTQNLVQRSRWISRVVDPAYRIIADGATRIFPYFFSKAAAATAPDAHDQLQVDELQNKPQEYDSSIPPSSNKLESAPIGEVGSNSRGKADESNFIIGSQPRALNGVTGILELERLMEGKTFSQAETDRLIEIINSRVIDLPGVKIDEKTLEMPSREGAKKHMSFPDTGEGPSSSNDTNSELWATPAPLAKSIIHDQAGVSPVELAKAYMGGHTSSSSQGYVGKKERDCLDRDMLVAKSSAASLYTKPSACWPGVKLSEQCGFTTPQSQRERLGLLNLPRTPYSRTILSNSKSKLMQLQDDSSKHLDILQSPSQSVQTRHVQFNLSKGRDDGFFGPNRRSRKSTVPSMMSPYSRPFNGTSHLENSATIKSSEAWQPSTLPMSHETDGKPKELEVGTPTVPKHSSQVARMILDHLERSQPTPKDKSAELKLATSWRNPQSSNVVTQSSLNIHNEKKDGSAKLNEDIQKFSSHNQPSSALKPSQITTGVLVDAMNKTSSASNGIYFGSHESSSSGTTQYELQKPKGPFARNPHEKLVSSSHDTAKAVSFSFGGEPANLPKPSSHSPGSNKRALPSISVAKPIQRWTVPSDSSITFTFPVSSGGGASSEPTTPSIMPTTSTTPSGVAITNHQKGKDDEIPNFGFNSKNGGSSPVVFAFPSMSEELSHGDDARLGIIFNFGSEKPERISFSLTGNDGVCC